MPTFLLSSLAPCKRSLFLNHAKLGVYKGEQAAPHGCLHLAINYCHKIYTSSLFLLSCFIFPASVMNLGHKQKTKNSITATYWSQFTNNKLTNFDIAWCERLNHKLLLKNSLFMFHYFCLKDRLLSLQISFQKELLLSSEKARRGQINI